MSATGGSRAANLVLAAVSLVAFLGIAEAVCRAVDLRPRLGSALANPPWLGDRWLLPREDYREGLAAEGFLGRYYDLYEWDRWRFYRLRPDRELSFLDPFTPKDSREATRWTVHTGPEGYRTPPFHTTPEPGTRRVVALGDSSTFGWGVEDSETYPAQLADALLHRYPQPDGGWEVINLGVPGYSTFQGVVMLEREALHLAPDVVLWSYLANDGAMTGEADRATFAQREGLLGGLLDLLHRSRAYETLEAWIARARGAVAAAPRSDVRNVASLAEAKANARAAADRAGRAGVTLVFVANCVRGSTAAVLETVARETGAPYLDATALIESSLPRIASDPQFANDRETLAARYGADRIASDPRLYGFLPDLCHPNAIGHRLIAEALAEQIEQATR